MNCSVLLTGATGFVGSQLLEELQQNSNFDVHALVRRPVEYSGETSIHLVEDIGGETDFSKILAGIDVVIHTAARAHIMKDEADDPLVEYRRVNVDGTLNLARQAAKAGVKRFVFISSVKVNGESTSSKAPFNERQTPAPEDDYGRSKLEAEEGLKELCKNVDMELVILRPPLVYGPGVKANFRSLMKLCAKPLPLPFGGVRNKRSMLYLGNLVDVVIRCIEHPAAANETFLVSDDDDLSLRALIMTLREAMGMPSCLIPIPTPLFRLAGTLLGKSAAIERLVGDLQLDSSKVQDLLQWKPPFSSKEGLTATATAYKNRAVDLQRTLDFICAVAGLIVGSPAFLIIYAAGLLDTGSPLFMQKRVGRDMKPFVLIKFRTMKPNTASVASHLADSAAITPLGKFLRRTKLDELPQLWNVLKGDMSFVGPRPNLWNQEELINERNTLGVYSVRPGITGLAQVNNIDMSTPKLLAETDARMIQEMSLGNYFKFIIQTVIGKGKGDAVTAMIKEAVQ